MSRSVPTTDKLRRPPIKTVKLVVMKVGGARLLEPAFLEKISAHVRDHWTAGERVVLVHGHGGVELLPGTDRALATTLLTRGLINTTLVGRLVRDGVPAVGLSGVDLGLAHADRDGGAWVEGAPLRRLLEEGLVPVLAPVVLDADGRPAQTCPDDLAQAVAKGIGADTLAMFGDAPAPCRHVEEGRVRDLLARDDVDPALRLRLQSALAALRQGIRDVRLSELEGLLD